MWNAAALDISFSDIADGIQRFSRYEPPANVFADMQEWHGLVGQLILEKASPPHLRLRVLDAIVLRRIEQFAEPKKFLKTNR